MEYGDAERDGYIILKHAIPEDIIAEIQIDESEFEVSPSGQYKAFKKAALGRVIEYFVENVPKEPLINLGVSKSNAEKSPERIFFGQYLLDTSESQVQKMWAGQPHYVYVTIALSQRLSSEDGLPEFVCGSHKPAVRTFDQMLTTGTNRITLYKGWAVVWTSQLAYKWPQGGGGLYLRLRYLRGE
ncbi:hypothetical protein K469DRAFT_696961 [Zopfia rhizophila CBS 207.26]|uniref:Uncharacterized protein n=1 Tax=Zopfia rhizophila CBS 207.26 TaxID=1314779 RepID=A0A6A6EIM7_9PEZI|nr:hypothetical protein K469DRAFT_696961 [Zopfia rhizophila CBS 207.26]